MKYPTTKKTLIDKLHDGDEISWDEFYEKYHGIIIEVGRAKGLTEDECKDLVQESMICFFRKTPTFRFDPGIAKFRTYFSRIVHGKIVDIIRKRMPTVSDISDGSAVVIAEQDAPDNAFDKILLDRWRNLVLEEAKELLRTRVKPETFQAFELYVLQGRDPIKVAEALGMTMNQVYVAKTRCTKALEKILKEFDDADPQLGLQN